MNEKIWGIQIGGDHYKKMAIQPTEFIMKNNLSFLEGCIVKRICRHKGGDAGRLDDLNKIKHEVDMIIDLEFSLHEVEQALPLPGRDKEIAEEALGSTVFGLLCPEDLEARLRRDVKEKLRRDIRQAKEDGI